MRLEAVGMLIAYNKPYGVLSQFTSDAGLPTLADHIALPGVYAAGRLDLDSEGLLLLTDDGALQRAIADPAARLAKHYWAEVEGVPTAATLQRFGEGLTIGEGASRYRARPASARAIDASRVPPRDPPIRVRAHQPTSWIEVVVDEGRNRQVRRMTAAVGHPTLRLMRVRIGGVHLFELGIAQGMWTAIKMDRLALPNMSPRRPPSQSRSPGEADGGALSTGVRRRR